MTVLVGHLSAPFLAHQTSLCNVDGTAVETPISVIARSYTITEATFIEKFYQRATYQWYTDMLEYYQP